MRVFSQEFFERYAGFVVQKYKAFLLISVLVTSIAAISASRFTIKTDFAELLPQDEPSILDLERYKKRVTGLSSMIVVVTGKDIESNKLAVEAFADKFKRLSGKYIDYIKYHIKDEKQFYEENKHLYVELDDLEEIYKRLKDKLYYERVKNNPVLGMDFDGEELKPISFDVSDIREKYKKKTASSRRYLDGYLTGEDGQLFAILLYPPATSTGVDFGREMLRAIQTSVLEVCSDGKLPPARSNPEERIDKECAERFHPTLRVGFTGGVVTAIVEQEAIIEDLILVTCVCLFFVALAVSIYFNSLRSILIIGVPLLMGTIWTFGISIYIVEHLNTCTAFLAAIIVGNGINFGLIQFARFAEERRTGKDFSASLAGALKYTAKTTSIAALAASIAYGSLIITRFRGFNGFGYMGGLGMVLCWISAFTVQPAFLTFIEKLKPFRFKNKKPLLPQGFFSKPFSRLVCRYGTGIHLVGWVFAIACIVVTIPYLKDPFEYDFRKLRNPREGKSAYELSGRVDKIFSKRLNPLFILADREDQVPLIQAELIRKNSEGPNQDLFDEIQTVSSYLPDQQEKKIRVLKRIRRALSKSTLSWLSEKERTEVEEYRPPENLKPLRIEDLPYALTRMFTEKDGRMGLGIALYPHKKASVWDGHFLMKISDASRVVELPNGEKVTSAGVATIFADMIHAIERDGPRAVWASLLGVVVLVILVYRALKYIILVVLALFLGIVWTIGPAAMIDLKLNFLNFIALPITFGIGIDYAVNVLNRYRLEGPGSIEKVISNTGGAVMLCSLTTIIGYSSLLIADNQALVSFGILAVIGEFASLFAAVLALPVMILWAESLQNRRKNFTL